MHQTAIRVILADDHGVVRRGIKEFLTEAGDIQVVGEADSGTQALALIARLRPDVAVLDIQMPGGSGIEVARHLRVEGANVGILILTAYDDPPYIRAALDAGANGYILKSSEADAIVEAVRAVHEGKTVLDAGLTVTPSALPDAEPAARLTEREAEVLLLVARGLTNKAIGFRLSISDRTVQGHLANIYEKLNAASRTEAVTRAAALRLIEVPHL